MLRKFSYIIKLTIEIINKLSWKKKMNIFTVERLINVY